MVEFYNSKGASSPRQNGRDCGPNVGVGEAPGPQKARTVLALVAGQLNRGAPGQ